jgi:hypothetical protein
LTTVLGWRWVVSSFLRRMCLTASERLSYSILNFYQFWLACPIGSAVAAAGYFILPSENIRRAGPRAALDYWGAALATSGMILLTFVISSGGVYGWGKVRCWTRRRCQNTEIIVMPTGICYSLAHLGHRSHRGIRFCRDKGGESVSACTSVSVKSMW